MASNELARKTSPSDNEYYLGVDNYYLLERVAVFRKLGENGKKLDRSI